MSDASDSARYIRVPKASGPGKRRNTCGGCGAFLDVTNEGHHSVLQCLEYLRMLIDRKAEKGHIHEFNK